jgi:hypothetical protein
VLKKILESRKKSEKQNRLCMFADCREKAIKSHVLQKNGVLREISEKNHLVQPLPPSPFETAKKGIFDFRKIGVNDVYTFKGFCSEHDNGIFQPIESNENLDFTDSNQQALFSYRGLCQEIRRKEISVEWLNDLMKLCPIETIYMMQSSLNGYKHGIENLTFFKKELEKAIKNDDYSSFEFKTIKIPRLELCVSVPLNIKTSADQKLDIPYTTSFVNVFPKGDFTYVIGGFHKDYKCSWTQKFITKMRSSKKDKIFKELSDLVTMRLEFWAMSPKLFRQIPATDVEKYKQLFTQNVFNHDAELRTELNLFKNA